MSVPWTSFANEIRHFLPGCPDIVIAGQARNVAQDFCRDTLSWQDKLDPITIDPNVRDIVLQPLPDSRIVQIRHVWNDMESPANPSVFPPNLDDAMDKGLVVLPRTEEWLDITYPGWRSATGTPRYYTSPIRDILWLFPHWGDPGHFLNLKVALQPSENSQSCPDDLFADYKQHIQHGILESLLLVPGKPWTNAALWKKFADDYKSDEGQAFVRQSRSNTRAPIRTTMNHRF